MYSEHFMIYLGEYQKEENKPKEKTNLEQDDKKAKFINFLLNLFGVA